MAHSLAITAICRTICAGKRLKRAPAIQDFLGPAVPVHEMVRLTSTNDSIGVESQVNVPAAVLDHANRVHAMFAKPEREDSLIAGFARVGPSGELESTAHLITNSKQIMPEGVFSELDFLDFITTARRQLIVKNPIHQSRGMSPWWFILFQHGMAIPPIDVIMKEQFVGPLVMAAMYQDVPIGGIINGLLPRGVTGSYMATEILSLSGLFHGLTSMGEWSFPRDGSCSDARIVDFIGEESINHLGILLRHAAKNAMEGYNPDDANAISGALQRFAPFAGNSFSAADMTLRQYGQYISTVCLPAGLSRATKV